MKTQITAFFMAWGMFLSIPCPAKIWDEKARPWQLVYLPLVGLLVGAIWALAAYLTGLFGRLPAICAAILAALPFLLTGFIHLDGFMDCCDAILSRRDLATRQKILKDSHVGSFAVVCTIFLMLAMFAAFRDFDVKNGFWGLILIPVFSRFASSFCVFACRPMQTSQYASGFEAKQNKRQLTALVILNVLAVLAGLLLLPHAWADTFTEQGLQSAARLFAIYDEAVANGATLTEDDQANIDATVMNLTTYASLYGYSNVNGYIAAMYGAGCRCRFADKPEGQLQSRQPDGRCRSRSARDRAERPFRSIFQD